MAQLLAQGVEIARTQGLFSRPGQRAGDGLQPLGFAFDLLLKLQVEPAKLHGDRGKNNDRHHYGDSKQHSGLESEASKHISNRAEQPDDDGSAAHAHVVDAIAEDVGNGLAFPGSVAQKLKAGQRTVVAEFDHVAVLELFR